MSWYRTYRPQRFSDLHSTSVRQAYLRLLESGTFSHAYLLTGPKGTGKTSGARILAKMLNCDGNKEAVLAWLNDSTNSKKKPVAFVEPCNTCSSCISITKGSSMSVVEMDAASNRGIDDIRELRERIGLSPADGQVSVYIIDEVHMLTTEAFNALLKVLEEPPAHVVFILATTDPQKIPATVISRCTSIRYSKATTEEIAQALEMVAAKESLQSDAEVFTRIAKLADGSFRDAVKLLESVGSGKKTVNVQDLELILGPGSNSQVSALLNALIAKDSAQVSAVFEALQADGRQGGSFQIDVIKTLHDRLLDYAKTGDKRLATVVALFKHVAVPLEPSLPIPWIGFELACLEWTLGESMEAFAPVAPAQKSATAAPVKFVAPAARPQRVAKEKEVEVPIPKAPVEPPPVVETAPLAIEEPSSAQVSTVDFSLIESKWITILQNVKIKSNSVEGLLRATRPKAITNNKLIIEAGYQFHKEQLEIERNRHVIETVVESICGSPLRVEFVVGIKTTVINSPHNNVSGAVADDGLIKAAAEAFS